MMTPRSPLGVGFAGGHNRSGQPNHVERPAEIDADHAHERIECVGPVFPEHFLREHDAGSIDHAAQRSHFRCHSQPVLNAPLVGHVDRGKARTRAEPGCDQARRLT